MPGVAFAIDPTTGQDFGVLGRRSRNPPITRRLTINTTPGDEYFVEEDGVTPFVGVGQQTTFNTNMPRTDAEAQREAKHIARFYRWLRIMHFDSVGTSQVTYSAATGTRCGWWNVDPRAGALPLPLSDGPTTADARSSVAVANMNRFIRYLREAGVRGFMSFDHLGYVLEGMGVPPMGGRDTYPYMGHYWLAVPLQALKDYLTFIFSTSCDYSGYTSGLTWGTDPFWQGLCLMNEQDVSRGFNDGGATDGFDRIVADGRVAADAEMQANWQAFWNLPENSWGTAPTWPMNAYVDGVYGHPLLSAYTPVNRERWTLFLLNRKRFYISQIKAHLATVAPGLHISGATSNFGMLAGEDGSDFQEPHQYLHTGTGYFTDPSNPVSITLAQVLTTGVLTVTLSGAPTQALSTSRHVRLQNLSGGTPSANNLIMPITSVISTTKFTVALTGAAVQNYVTTGATCVVLADLKDPHGECRIADGSYGGYSYVGAGFHMAGKPMFWGEYRVKGVARRETEHYFIAALLSLKLGWTGYTQWSHSVGQANFTRGTIVGDSDSINAHWLSDFIAGLMLEHKTVGPANGGVVIADMTDAAFAARVTTTQDVKHDGYSTLASPADYTRPMFSGKRMRFRRNASVTNIDSAQGSLGAPATAGTNVFTWGTQYGKVKWCRGNATPSGGVVSDNERIEINETALPKQNAVCGRIHNGTYGLMTISGLPSDGWYGTITWITYDGSTLGNGVSCLVINGMNYNTGFAFLDADERFYASYANGAAVLTDVPSCTITLNTTGLPDQVVTAADANGTETSTSDATAGTGTLTFDIGSEFLYVLRADIPTPDPDVTTDTPAALHQSRRRLRKTGRA